MFFVPCIRKQNVLPALKRSYFVAAARES